MKPLTQVSLRRKMVLAIMLTAGPALLVALAAFLAIEIQGYRRAAHRELLVLAEVLGEGATASLQFDDTADAARLLATLDVHRRIVDAVLFDRAGRVFSSYSRDGRTAPPVPKGLPSDGSAFEGGYLWLTRPVHHGGEMVGTLFLRSDLVDLNSRIRWGLTVGLLLTLLIGGASLLIAIRLGHVFSDPILHLAATARRVADHQDSGERAVRETQDEVGVLVDAFNGMLDQLGERRARLEEAQRLAHLGSWALDPATGRFEWSEETHRIFGWPLDSPPPPFERFLESIHPEDRGVAAQMVQKARTDVAGFAGDHRLLLPDGTLRWVHLSGTLFIHASGREILRGTLMDITERKKAEDALLQAQKLESLGVLTGGIAHDFNNLLGALMGNLELARSALEEGTSADAFLARAEGITRKAADFTRQMLAYSGKSRFEVKPLDLSHVVGELGHLLSISISKKTELRYQLAENLPAVLADTSQLQQVVMNLVINASESLEGGEGCVLLRTSTRSLDEADLQGLLAAQEMSPGPHVILEVEDNGRGMDAHTLARIFDPFFTTKFQGRGLGLAAMMGIVKGHRGGIKVYSEVGRGTTFKLFFPASARVAEGAVPLAAVEDYRGSGLVLVVDDEATIREAASALLRNLGFEPVQAVDGREGLEKFEQIHERLRFVLLDLTMPRMDGADCFKAMRALDPKVPVLLTSGFSQPENVETLKAQGLAGFLPKPFHRTALVAMVKAVLS